MIIFDPNRSCPSGGTECDWRGGAFVSLNMDRRHLDEAQPAMVAAKLANLPPHRPENKSANLPTSPMSQSAAAALLNVPARTVSSATKIRDEAVPELVATVERGRASVPGGECG